MWTGHHLYPNVVLHMAHAEADSWIQYSISFKSQKAQAKSELQEAQRGIVCPSAASVQRQK